jgi:thiamine biosynthesis lipoprotein
VSAARATILAVLSAAALCAGSARASTLELSGSAFGTTWHVRVPRAAAPDGRAASELGAAIQAALDEVDALFSTWRSDSEVTRFNASRSTDWVPVAPETARVVAAALAVYARSDGALDPTVAPLVALWGFGPRPADGPPSAAALAEARRRVGAGALAARRDPPALRKARPDLALDLSAVAKGHGVDAVAARLEALGVARFLVEVGGELRGRGDGPDGGPWRVGVERPEAGPQRVGWVVTLADAALATSGTTRNEVTWPGEAGPHTHVIDPRSGRPVEHDLVSVSVLAEDAARADAWATALLVLGPDAGPQIAERERLAALFVSRRGGGLEARATPAMEAHLGAPEPRLPPPASLPSPGGSQHP